MMFKEQPTLEKNNYTQLRKQIQNEDTITAEALTSPLLQNGSASALHWAAKEGHIDVFQKAIELKANVSLLDRQGNTPLHYAMTAYQDNTALFLLSNKADVTVQNKEDDTPLHLYAARGAQGGDGLLSQCVAQLLPAMTVCNLKKQTPLHSAVTHDNLSFVIFWAKRRVTARYYENYPLDFTHTAFNHEKNNLIKTTVLRLEQKLENNLERTWLMLYYLTLVVPLGQFKATISSNYFSKSLVQYAKEYGALDNIQLLLASPESVKLQSELFKQVLGETQVVQLQLENKFNEQLEKQQQQLKEQQKQIESLQLKLSKLLENLDKTDNNDKEILPNNNTIHFFNPLNN